MLVSLSCKHKHIFLWSQEIGEKLSEIGGRLDYPHLTNDLVQDIEALWKDPAIQVILLWVKHFDDLLQFQVLSLGLSIWIMKIVFTYINK